MLAFLCSVAWFALLLAENMASGSSDVPPYDLPVLPQTLPEYSKPNSTYDKFVPRKIWVAVKDVKDELPGHLKAFFKRNEKWDATICDNDCKDQFMNTTFAGTSVQWAYHLIRSPPFFASKADIWRYAVLYTYGGMYIDDDSDIGFPLDEVVKKEDRLVVSEEGYSSMGDCYTPTYHLSDTHTYYMYSHNLTAAKHYTGVDRDQQPQFFHGNTILNWAMFAAPRHPVYLRALQNIVEIVKSMYLRHSVVHMTRWDVKFKPIFCTTGFVLTYSIRELELEGALQPDEIPRVLVNNFKEYGGKVKAISTQNDPNHYRKQLKNHAPSFLTEMVPLNMEHFLQYLDGKAVMGDSGKEIWLIQNGQKRTFPDYETFLKMEFTDKHTKHISDYILNQIPDGPRINRNEAIISAYSKTHVHSVLEEQKKDPHNRKHLNRLKSAFMGAEHARMIHKSQELIVQFLQNASHYINKREMGCWGDDYGGTRDNYLQGVYEDVLQGVPVMAYPLCTGMFQLGNTLGYYLNDIACADLTGAHFIAVHKKFGLSMPDLLVTHPPPNPLPAKDFVGTVYMNQDKNLSDPTLRDPRYAFFHNLPDLIPNSRPLEASEVKANMKAKCHCLQFCWENNEAPWLQRVPLIGQVLRPAIDAYVKASNAERTGTVLNHEVDRTTALYSDFLPLIPNVTIQYRCGDNVGFGKTKYGLLPFSAYKAHRIPRDVAKYIYIIADSPKRSATHVYSSRCETILNKLYAYLTVEHPQATLVLKRGGDLFLDYARIAYSNVVVCSASTFCLWPALANQHGQVHYPLTPLIAKADTNASAPRLAPNFHWITEVEMLKDFKKYRPWDRLIDDLMK